MPLIKAQATQISELKGRKIPDFDLKTYKGSYIFNPQTKGMIAEFLGTDSEKAYQAGSDGFAAFAKSATTNSKLRLAHRYGKNCDSITLFKQTSDMLPSTEHTFSQRV